MEFRYRRMGVFLSRFLISYFLTLTDIHHKIVSRKEGDKSVDDSYDNWIRFYIIYRKLTR